MTLNHLKRALLSLCSLLLSGAALAADAPAISGQLMFFNDECSFLLDLGLKNTGNSLGGKLSGVKGKEGAAAAIKKLIPRGARVLFKVTKTSSYPEGNLYFNGQELGSWLVSKGLATRIKP